MRPISAVKASHPLQQHYLKMCRASARPLLREHTAEWLQLIAWVIRYYRGVLRCSRSRKGRYFRTRCRQTLQQSRWELMLLSMYGFIPSEHLSQMEQLQVALERSIAA